MRRHLLSLLALLMLLMQPAALLHVLSHATPGNTSAALAAGASVTTGSAATRDDGAVDAHAAGLDCLQCLAFAALGGTAPPLALLLFRAPLLRHAAPAAASRLLGGGTGAGYHARGPPRLA